MQQLKFPAIRIYADGTSKVANDCDAICASPEQAKTGALPGDRVVDAEGRVFSIQIESSEDELVAKLRDCALVEDLNQEAMCLLEQAENHTSVCDETKNQISKIKASIKAINHSTP